MSDKCKTIAILAKDVCDEKGSEEMVKFLNQFNENFTWKIEYEGSHIASWDREIPDKITSSEYSVKYQFKTTKSKKLNISFIILYIYEK